MFCFSIHHKISLLQLLGLLLCFYPGAQFILQLVRELHHFVVEPCLVSIEDHLLHGPLISLELVPYDVVIKSFHLNIQILRIEVGVGLDAYEHMRCKKDSFLSFISTLCVFVPRQLIELLLLAF